MLLVVFSAGFSL